jgi:hypothetical protein
VAVRLPPFATKLAGNWMKRHILWFLHEPARYLAIRYIVWIHLVLVHVLDNIFIRLHGHGIGCGVVVSIWDHYFTRYA